MFAAMAACRASHAAEPQADVPPPGQVWLTADEVAREHIEVTALGEQKVDGTLLASAHITFDENRVSHLYSPVSGRVTEIDAQLGQRVKKGERLAVIQSHEIGSAVADESKGAADLLMAQHDYDREKKLERQHATTDQSVEQADDNVRRARAEAERASQKVRLLRSGVIDGSAQTYTLTAPIDGQVLARTISPGQEVQGLYSLGTFVELFTVGELDRLWVLADVYEADIGRLVIGAQMNVSVLSDKSKDFVGHIDWISGVLDPLTRTARVRCALENPDGVLRPEMFATARIATEGHAALVVSRDALVHLGDQDTVFVDLGDAPGGKRRFERLPVAVDGDTGADMVPVLHGLDLGVRVVTAGAKSLSTRL